MLPVVLFLIAIALPLAAAPPAASVPVTIEVPQSMRGGPFAANRTLTVPPGFRVSLIARVDTARFLARAPNGDIFVSQPTHGKVLIIRRQAMPEPQIFEYVSGLRLPHDVVFHTIGATTYVYIAESHQVNRFVYVDGDTTARSRQVVVTGLPDRSTPELGSEYGHPFKNIMLDRNNKLYVSIASSCNACAEDTVSDPVRGAIYQYNADGTGRRLFARGIRNAEGLARQPGTDQLWVVVNGRDEIAYPRQDSTGNYGKVIQSYVDDHPPEPFIAVRDGGNYGWPFCNPTQDSPSGFDDMLFERDVQTNRNGTVNCDTMDRITRGIQAHSAPLGLSFLHESGFPAEYRAGAVVALHGSWNRESPTGYKVVHFPWNTTTQRPEPPIDLVTGFINGRTVWGRPVDVIPDGDGLLISDDRADAVYRLFPSNGTSTCSFTLNTTSAQFTSNGGSGNFRLTPNTNLCAWSASSDSSWAQVFPLTGFDARDLQVTVYPNYSTRARTAFIQAGGLTLRIDQAASQSNADERFVSQMYFNFFGRIPPSGDLAYHVNSLRTGLSRAGLIANFLSTAEFVQGGRFAAGLYVGILGRNAEYGGWLFQRNALATGATTPNLLLRSFLESAEYSLVFGSPDEAAYVRLLYRNILGREAQTEEIPIHVTALLSGTPRHTLAAGFLSSDEFIKGTEPKLTAFLLYSAILLRDPSPQERSSAEMRLRSGSDVRTMIAELLGSSEFANLVN